ncbi:hypothetical protein [Endozoicomonas atrinae]|uniref:hypothetical protein n=1 Tax=Endozoicomonas atrinae TaxID=1333660 RepID=UPI003B00737D
MKIIMNTHFIKTLDDVKTLLSQEACLEPGWDSKDECYQWIEQTLSHFKYRSLGREGKGLIRRYLTVASGYSTAQVTRLINQYLSFTTPIDIFLKPVVKGLIRYSGILFCHLFNTSSKA